MNYEILAKMAASASVAGPSEADVRHLFALARKLVEQAPNADSFGLLKPYADWMLHSKIDRSGVGATVVQRVNDLVFDHIHNRTNNSAFAAELSAVLSLGQVRTQLNQLVEYWGGGSDLVSAERWRAMVPLVAESISNTPLTIAKHKRFRAILAAIGAKPLKGSSVVEERAIIKMPSSTFYKDAPADQITFCVMLTTTDTTRLVTPLAKTERL